MKPILTFITILFLSFFDLHSQTIDVVTGLDSPSRLLLNGNDLYFSSPGEVFKIDITQNPAIPVSVIGGLTTATGLALGDNILYIAEFNAGRISKIDITDPIPTLETVISSLNTPNGLVLSGNFLYYSDNNENIVARIDITDPNPTPVIVATSAVNFSPLGMAIQGNILYMAQGISNRVSKVDVSSGVTQPIDVVVGVNRPVGIRMSGNNLYITERNDNKISVKNVTDGTTTATDLVTGLNLPLDIEIAGSTLYILESGANKISKVENILGIDNINFNNNHKLYPNPAEDFVQLSNLKETVSYNIYSILGTKISEGQLFPNEKINTETLAKGTYILSLANGSNLRFIKN